MRLCLHQSLSICRSVFVSVHICTCIGLSAYVGRLCLFASVALPLSVSVCLLLSVSLSVCFCLFASISVFLFLSVSFCLLVSVC